MTTTSQWQVGGNAAENYEQLLVPPIFGPWAEDLVNLCKPETGQRVLDVACGTGVVARVALARVGETGKVTGLDLNPGMLALARTTDRTGRIEWHEGNALQPPFEAGSFDVVLCQQAVQFFPDRSKAFAEMRRVLVPRGRVGIAVWQAIEHSPGFHAFAQSLTEHASKELGAIVYSPFGFASEDALVSHLTAAGFHNVVVHKRSRDLPWPSVDEFARHYIAGSPLAGPFGALAADVRDKVLADLRTRLGAHVKTNGTLVFPIASHLAVAST